MYGGLQYRNLGNGTVECFGKCVFTKKDHSVIVPIEGFLRWFFEGELIQNAMPDVDADTREFLISGISPEGWNQRIVEDPQ